jgi:hypothetical protein
MENENRMSQGMVYQHRNVSSRNYAYDQYHSTYNNSPDPLSLLPSSLLGSIYNVFPFPPANAPSYLLYKPASCSHLGNARSTLQGLCPIRPHPGYTPCHCRHPQGDTIPRLSLEAFAPHRAMLGSPSHLLPSSTLFISLVSSFAQRTVRSPHVFCSYCLCG